MKYKTRMLADRLAAELSQWPGVECVILNEPALSDTLDPYFALILDVFHGADIPSSDERFRLFGEDVAAFETAGRGASQGEKDRFLVMDIPVRLEYKSTANIEKTVSFAGEKMDSLWLVRDAGTYRFYRLEHGEVLFSRSGWIEGIRERLGSLSGRFWEGIRSAHQSRMEHYLSDLGAACYQKDRFHYLLASAGFIKTACLTLFCINRQFEPSHRSYYRQVLSLPLLPESFRSQFETFFSEDSPANMERRYSLAQLIARGIVGL